MSAWQRDGDKIYSPGLLELSGWETGSGKGKSVCRIRKESFVCLVVGTVGQGPWKSETYLL